MKIIRFMYRWQMRWPMQFTPMVVRAIFLTLIVLFVFVGGSAADIYVTINGSDNNTGTREQPLRSLATALRKARELRRLADPSVNGGIHIYIGKGIYYQLEPIFIRPEDSGTEASPTWIEAMESEQPVLSGGVTVSSWKQLAGNIPGVRKEVARKLWVADVPVIGTAPLNFRQLWVNGRRATRAKDANGDSMRRILSWNHADQTCWIPAPTTSGLSTVNGMEMFIHQWWATAVLRISKMEIHGDSARLSFQQPESRIQSEHPWPAPWISATTGNSAFYLSNAIQFLDQPGEWFLDIKTQKIYYYPLPGDNIKTADVVAPYLEQVLQVRGTIDNPVSFVYFKGIAFEHAGWLRPSMQGHVAHQAGMYMLDAYKLKIPGTTDKKGLENQAWIGRPAAAVELSYAHHTAFLECRFEHLGSTGLDYQRGTHDDEIRGNLFKDISGSGILVGVFADEGFEIHRPYNPSDEREVCTNERISNNLVTEVTNEDWGCVGIGAGYVKGINIEHNEVSNVSYSAISMGWGWTRTINAMSNNRIVANHLHHYGKHMYDVSAIYTLSAQPGSMIADNYVDSIYKAPYAHDPDHWFYLYTDEGSSYFSVKNNWTPAQKFLQNANGPGNSWDNNGPQVADSVKLKAGLEGKYRSLWKERTIDKNWLINACRPPLDVKAVNPYAAASKPIVVEVVDREGAQISSLGMVDVFGKAGANDPKIYQWKNHLVRFGTVKDTLEVRKTLAAKYPGAVINIYYDMFYVFNRQHCTAGTSTDEWNNTILSANMAADPKLQQEYLDYHATQFQQWPELSKGFCNADFQQLVIFKSGRQLILIISIPRGASLDKLNPRTMENNPRVNDWNTLMKKYQEGIPGTDPGEVWAFFKEVN